MSRTAGMITGVYRPRQPLESDFHRLVREHFDDFRTVYADRYGRKFDHWRAVYDKAIGHFLECGDLQHGFTRVRCPKCGGTMKIIAFIEADQGDIIRKILEHCGL